MTRRCRSQAATTTLRAKSALDGLRWFDIVIETGLRIRLSD
jgi:hypothetical protein